MVENQTICQLTIWGFVSFKLLYQMGTELGLGLWLYWVDDKDVFGLALGWICGRSSG